MSKNSLTHIFLPKWKETHSMRRWMGLNIELSDKQEQRIMEVKTKILVNWYSLSNFEYTSIGYFCNLFVAKTIEKHIWWKSLFLVKTLATQLFCHCFYPESCLWGKSLWGLLSHVGTVLLCACVCEVRLRWLQSGFNTWTNTVSKAYSFTSKL